jgi:hypothetical protein
MLFQWLYPSGMAISTRAEKLILESRIGVDSSCSWLMADLRRIRRGNYMPDQWFVNNLLHSEEIQCIDSLK